MVASCPTLRQYRHTKKQADSLILALPGPITPRAARADDPKADDI
jgi:hypothetical protein